MFNPKFQFVTLAEMIESLRSGLPKVPRDIELIVGLPRSGMIPAYALGLYLNLPVMDIGSFIDNRFPENGRTRNPKNVLSEPQLANTILLLDDSYASGISMRSAKERIKTAGYTGKIVTCAVILDPLSDRAVDLHFMQVPMPRCFEWNVFHHSVLSNACLDFDGVLCVDPTEEENDDGEKYRKFLLEALPLFVPTQKIAHIVSARLEKFRPETEAWLEKNGVKYERLHLLNLPSKEDRIRTQAHHGHKIKAYVDTGAALFIESSIQQAKTIACATGKPVLCVDQMVLIQGEGAHLSNFVDAARQRKRQFTQGIKQALLSWLSPTCKMFIKNMIKHYGWSAHKGDKERTE